MKNYMDLLTENIVDKNKLKKFHIYALWKDNEIVYVGQTTNLGSRLNFHLRDKDFDYYSYFECKTQIQLDNIESELIVKLQPAYNKAIGKKHISIFNLRKKIRNLGKEYKYKPEYYVSNLIKKLNQTDVEVVNIGKKSYIHMRDLNKAINLILGDEVCPRGLDNDK